MPTINVTDETFERDVLRSAKPVLVDFWATWCAPCKTVAPALEALSDELADRVTIAKVDVDECPRTAGALRIQSIPTMVLFVDGRPVQAVQGAQPKEKLRTLLDDWLPGPASPSIKVPELQAALDSGRPVHVIDIRPEIHYSRSHLAGAKCVEPEKLADAIAEQGPGGLTVLICRTGEESLAEAIKLSQAGLPVRALEKGLLEWEGSGLPTYSTKEEEALAAEAAS